MKTLAFSSTKTFILLSTILLGSFAHAGIRVGNGGDAVICPTGVKLLDLYEGEKLGGRFLDGAGKSDQILEERLAIVKKMAPELGKTLEKRHDEFQKSYKLVESELTDIDDAHNVVKPECKNGKIEQIAVRVNGASAPEPKWLLREDLWKQLSERDRAALILHEIVYEHFNGALGEKDSVKVRRFVRFVMSKDFETGDKEAFWKFISDQKLPIYRN